MPWNTTRFSNKYEIFSESVNSFTAAPFWDGNNLQQQYSKQKKTKSKAIFSKDNHWILQKRVYGHHRGPTKGVQQASERCLLSTGLQRLFCSFHRPSTIQVDGKISTKFKRKEACLTTYHDHSKITQIDVIAQSSLHCWQQCYIHNRLSVPASVTNKYCLTVTILCQNSGIYTLHP